MSAPSDITEVPEKFVDQVVDEKGQPLISTPQDEENLEALAKEDVDNARSWWAAMKLRLMRIIKTIRHV